MTPNPVSLCANASYISHASHKVTDIFEGKGPKNPLDYLLKIMKMGHLSVLEHAYFNLLIEDAPVTAEIFLIRFRLASFTVKSRRYTDVVKDGFAENLEKPLKASYLKKIREFYQTLMDSGVPLEDARFILPYAFKTNLILSVNGRELGAILYSALFEPQLPEIKTMGSLILSQVQEAFPVYENKLDLFKSGSTFLSPTTFSAAPFTPLPPVKILSSTANPDNTYSQALAFNVLGNLYQPASTNPHIFTQAPLIAHNRALETLNFTFYLRDISLAGLTHLLRHRMHSPILPALFSPSLPYSVILPPSIQEKGLEKEYFSLIKKSQELEEKHQNIYYRTVAALFPVVTSMNARELIHFFKLRLCTRAQWEIRDLAFMMLNEVKKLSPQLFNGIGPSCVISGYCPEGSHSCGRMKEMQKIFGSSVR